MMGILPCIHMHCLMFSNMGQFYSQINSNNVSR